MGTQLIKCGITQQVINKQTIQIIFVTATQKIHNVWSNKDGKATKTPFTTNKSLSGFFQISSLPIQGNFDDYVNFHMSETQDNVIPCFMVFRNIYGTDGYQNSHFNFQAIVKQFPNVEKTFNNNLFDLEDLTNFNYIPELSNMMQKLCYEIMFNNVSSYNPYTTEISQIHISTMMDCVYQELSTQQIPNCTHITSIDHSFNYYSDNYLLNLIFEEVNFYLKENEIQEIRNIFNQYYNVFNVMSFCNISLSPIVSAGQDYDNISGSIMQKLAHIAFNVALDNKE